AARAGGFARRFLRSRTAAAGLVILGVVLFAALFAGVISPYDPYAARAADALKPPSARNLLGTDDVGRDVLSRIIYGSRISLYVGLMSIGIPRACGGGLGVLGGVYGRRRRGGHMGVFVAVASVSAVLSGCFSLALI